MNDENVEPVEEPQETVEEQPLAEVDLPEADFDEPVEEVQPDTGAVLRHAKLEHLVKAWLPEDIDLEEELEHISGLSVGEDGQITGKARYRKPAGKATPPQNRQPRKTRAASTKSNARKLVSEINKQFYGDDYE